MITLQQVLINKQILTRKKLRAMGFYLRKQH